MLQTHGPTLNGRVLSGTTEQSLKAFQRAKRETVRRLANRKNVGGPTDKEGCVWSVTELGTFGIFEIFQ